MPKHCMYTVQLCFCLYTGKHHPAYGLRGVLFQQSAYHQENLGLKQV